MEKVTMYSKVSGCGWCVKALDMLKVDGYEIQLIKVGEDVSKEVFIADIFERTGCMVETVPQIFIGEIYVGGHDDLVAYREKQSENLKSEFEDFDL